MNLRIKHEKQKQGMKMPDDKWDNKWNGQAYKHIEKQQLKCVCVSCVDVHCSQQPNASVDCDATCTLSKFAVSVLNL